MTRALSLALRGGLAVTLALLVLAVSRWAPIHAEPLWDVRALPLGGLAVLLAAGAALLGQPRAARPVEGARLALVGVVAALGILVAFRVPAGLPASAVDPRGSASVLGILDAGPIDLLGSDLRALPAARKWSLHWKGTLRAPESGSYRLWAEGRGRVQVWLDGRPVLDAGEERLRAGEWVRLDVGSHVLEVNLRNTGPGPRLRLGWTRPRANGGPGGRDEMIPPRYLGPEIPHALWRATDLLSFAAALLVGVLAWRIPWDSPRRLPPPGPVARAEIFWSLAGHAVLVAAMSWPLVLDLAGSGVTDRPDGRLNAWILAWDAHALTHAPGRLFQAPAFHPLPDALAFSENLLVPAVLAWPALVLGGPVLGYNVVLLLSFVVSGLGAQLLVRRVSGDRLAAFVAGAIFAVGAHRWIRLAHLHAQVTLFLPLALFAFDAFWEKRTARRALLVGALLALQGLSSVYLGAITAAALAAAVGMALLGGLRGRGLSNLAAGFVLAAALMAPVVWPYLRMREFQGMEWTIEDVGLYATTLESYAASGTRLYGPLTQRHLDPDRVRDTVFPGLTVLCLGLAGLAVAPRRYRAVALVASAGAIAFSLGPETAAYRFLHEHLVFVRGIRALSRFSLIPVLALSVLAGLALARRWKLSLVALGLMLVESSNLPLRYAREPGPSAAARWLAGRTGAVVYLPLGEQDTRAMLDGVAHFRPLVNGDSGFVPRPYSRAMELLDGSLGEEGLRFLRAVGVTHVVSREELRLPVAATLGDDHIYNVTSGPVATVEAAGAAVPVRWTAEGIIIDRGMAGTMHGFGFELDDRPWVERPRVRGSLDGARWDEVDAYASLADAALALYANPRRGRGVVQFRPVTARYLRVDGRLPARPEEISLR